MYIHPETRYTGDNSGTLGRAPLVVLSVISFFVLAMCCSGKALAKDPWYIDVPKKQWYYRYIETLWDEEVINGYERRHGVGSRRRTDYFYEPDRPIIQAELAFALAKAFRLTPRNEGCSLPLSESYRLYARFYVYPWLCVAEAEGIIVRSSFSPNQKIRRDEAIALLIRGLGLGNFAESMTSSDARYYLSRFRDRNQVHSNSYYEMALAVHLQIVEGYTDSTLRPQNLLTRAEAAALIYRSALYVLRANPDVFTPDGDGIDDFTSISLQTLRNRNAARWNVTIENSTGTVVARASGNGEPVADVIWDGKDLRGRDVPTGTYYYYGQLWDRQGNEYRAARKPLILRRHLLTGQLFPQVVYPGERVRIHAWSSGWSNDVNADLPWDRSRIRLAPDRSPARDWLQNDWQTSFILPPDAIPGVVGIQVTAQFDDVMQSVVLPLEVRQPFDMSARLHPNPTRSGQWVELIVETNLEATEVTSYWLYGVGVLQRLNPEGTLWRYEQFIPHNQPDMVMPVYIWAMDKFGQGHPLEITLTILNDPRHDILFHLSD